MASTRIRGITIELGADASGVTKALKDIDSNLKTTQSNLKDINKLLKLDPKNTELLTQKQKNLESSIDLTKKRIEELKKAQENVAEGTAEWDALQREIISTEASLKDLEKQYKDFGSVASQQVKAVGESLKEAGGKVTDFGQKLAPVSGAATAFGTALLKIGYDAVTSSDDLNTLAKQTGFTTAEIQKMQYAADRIDVSFEDISGALKKFKSKIDPSNKALQALGISVTDADGNLRDATDVFQDAIVALSKIDNETEKDQVAMELFGKSADSLAGIIDDGGAALKEFGDEAENLGLILDQDTLDSLNATDDGGRRGASCPGGRSPYHEDSRPHHERSAETFRTESRNDGDDSHYNRNRRRNSPRHHDRGKTDLRHRNARLCGGNADRCLRFASYPSDSGGHCLRCPDL